MSDHLAIKEQAVGPIAAYHERSAGLRRTFELFPSKVVIRGRVSGDAFEAAVPLDRMNPEYGYRWSRQHRPAFAFTLTLILASATGAFVWLSGLPFLSVPVGVAVLLTTLAACLTIYCLPRVRSFSFTNVSGVTVLTVIESGPQRDRAEEFVRLTSAAIVALRAPFADSITKTESPAPQPLAT